VFGGRGPADDAAEEGVDDECDVDGAGPDSDVGEVGDPGAVRGVGDEAQLDQVGGPFGCPVLDGGDHFPAADGAGYAQFAHESLDGAAGDLVALAVQLMPDLAGAVDPAVASNTAWVRAFSSVSRADLADGGRSLAA
jgi:hypothetical protein